MTAAVVDPKILEVMWNIGTKPLLYFSKQFLSLTSGQKLLFVATFGLGFGAGRVRPFWKRYQDVHEIPPKLFGPQAPVLVGRAARITDGDTIRFLHQPTPFHSKTLVKGQKLSEFALPIRVCSMDTPETAKFGKKGQPFGEEAKQALKNLLGNNRVYVRLLQKDQYGRAVAQVFIRRRIPWIGPPLHVDEYMLKQGLAEVYTGGGAVYGPKGLETYKELEATARTQKLGIWTLGKRESASEYKKRTKE